MELAFLHIFAAASLSHKNARAHLAVFLENGIFPNKDILRSYIKEGERFEFLKYTSDINNLLSNDKYTIQEFKIEMQSRALINLYLSSLTSLKETDLNSERSIEEEK